MNSVSAQAVIEVSDRMLYDVEKMRRPTPNGALDARLVGYSEYTRRFMLADEYSFRRVYRARPESARPVVKDFKTVMVILAISDLLYQLFTLDT